jgi:glucokinase
MDKAIVGVDIGGTNTVVGIFDKSASLLLKQTIPTVKLGADEKSSHPKQFIDVLTETIHKLIDNAGGYKVSLVGIGMPGIVDSESGIAIATSNLRWKDVPLAELMRARLNAPVYIDNDVRMYTFGEALAGAGRGYNHIVCLTLGTGIAAGLMLNGTILNGSRWAAGEIGHDKVEGTSFPCTCGRTGCLETIASATGISRIAQEMVRSQRNTSLSQLKHTITSYDVYQAYLNGDEAAKEIFEYAGTVLGRKLATVVNLLDPEIIIIGGGVAAAGNVLIDPIRSEIKAGCLKQQQKTIVCTGQLTDSAGLIGAVHFALTKSGGMI